MFHGKENKGVFLELLVAAKDNHNSACPNWKIWQPTFGELVPITGSESAGLLNQLYI